MKKRILLLNILLLCFGLISAQQQNQKIVFPNPPNMSESAGQFVRPTSDGGFILSGSASNALNYGVPRLIKLNAALQVEWDQVYLVGNPPDGAFARLESPALPSSNGGYAVAVQNDSTATDFLLLDANGEILAQRDLFPWSNGCSLLGFLPGGGFLVSRTYNAHDLLQLDADGNLVQQNSLGNIGFAKSILLESGDVLTGYRQSGTTKMIFRRTDIAGNLIWQTQPFISPTLTQSFAATSDGGFVVIGYPAANDYRVYRFDGQGNQTWQSPAGAIPAILVPQYIEVASDGAILLSGKSVGNRGFAAKMALDGTGIEWSAESPEDGQEHLSTLNAFPTSDGWAIGAAPTTGNKFGMLRVSTNTGVSVNTLEGFVVKDNDEDCIGDTGEPGLQATHVYATNGSETFHSFSASNGFYKMVVPAGDYTISVAPNQPFFFLCPAADVSISFPLGSNNTIARNLPMQSQQLIHEINGTVRLDQDDNCVADAGEPLLENWYVQIYTGTHTLSTDTDADGQYRVFVPDGSYDVQLIPLNQHFNTCAPTLQTINLAGPDPQTAVADFLANPAFECARMRADLSATNARPCSTASIYAYYRNDGTTLAEDALMEVTLDPNLTFSSATITPVNVDGQTISFALGDLPPAPAGTWNSLIIYAGVSCSAQIGDQLCLTAQVQPDEMCVQSPSWSGAIVSVDGLCQDGDDAIFTVSNIGSATNVMTLDFTIIEDQIVLRQDNFQLAPGESKKDTVQGVGLPLTIIAQQEPGYPGDTSVTFVLLNCGGSSGQSFGFGGQPGPFIHQECFEIRNSYDPNDKDATPQGFGPDHIVHPGTPLEYRIRFQNTGNDTAFLVVLRDTLSQHLNFRKVEPRGSSHAYDFAQISDSILQFTFRNIVLPDSATNPAASQGFVDFTVYPKPGLPLGTLVPNRAAIYFDHNPPVITNTVERTYAKVISVSVNDPKDNEQLLVKVFPNPFVTETTFVLPENAPKGTYQLELLGPTGRLLRALAFNGLECRLSKGDMSAGVLAWAIRLEGRIVASGKVMAQ